MRDEFLGAVLDSSASSRKTAAVAAPDLAPALETVRLSLHVLAAAVWVGGQLTLAGLVPALRKEGGDTTRTAARAFAKMQWPAFLVLLATGVWNVIALHPDHASGTYRAVLFVKIAIVLAAGLSAYLHQNAKSKAALGAFGGLTALFSLAALVLGVLLAG